MAGQSLRQIAQWLDAEGLPSPRGNPHWNEAVVRRIIRGRVYAGRWQNREGRTIARCEAVVPADVFDRANEALRTRPKRGPASDDRPLLANLKCYRCGSPMYRIQILSWNKKHHYLYYRCTGSGPQRKGCGNMVDYHALNAVVAMRVFMISNEPHKERRWVEGENYDAQTSEVMQDIRELAADPLAEGFSERRMRCEPSWPT
jgi:hypothetical protein